MEGGQGGSLNRRGGALGCWDGRGSLGWKDARENSRKYPGDIRVTKNLFQRKRGRSGNNVPLSRIVRLTGVWRG